MAPVKLTDKDVDALIRIVATEADHKLIWSHPEEYSAQVHGIVDTVLNRVASGRWGNSVADVANADRQFSDINGPGKRGYGSVDKVPDSRIPAFLPNIVTSWVTQRGSGTPSSIGGNLHYANPNFSDASNMGWVNGLDGPKLGYGASTHLHGTTAGFTPVEATVEYGPRTGTPKLQDIKEKQAAAQGYGALPPSALTRPNSFNETGRPPIPLTRPPKPPSLARVTGVKPLDASMSPALQTARQARSGDTSSAAMAATPRITDTDTEAGLRRPSLDWGMFKPGVSAGGLGSLLSGGINPATPNPVKPPVQLARPLVMPTAKPASTFVSEDHPNSNTVDRSIIRTGQGIAGGAVLPAGYRPPASVMPAAPPRQPVASKPFVSEDRPTSNRPIVTTVANPDYTAWNEKYGDGSQIQTAPTGGAITRNQLAAISGSGAPIPLPRPATIPPAPPKTITVTRAAPLAPPPIAPLPRPYSDALMARANAMPKPLTLQEAVGSWWNGTALGQGINLVTGKAPPPQQSSGGLLGAVFGMVPRQAMAQATAKQAAKDPLGFAIGEANRKAAGPTYTVSGDNNSFMPASVQNSSRWQTGY